MADQNMALISSRLGKLVQTENEATLQDNVELESMVVEEGRNRKHKDVLGLVIKLPENCMKFTKPIP
jgi:hypothetical protein